MMEPYKYGFSTDTETEQLPPGLNEEVITQISLKKNEPQWLLDWRLKAYQHWGKILAPNNVPRNKLSGYYLFFTTEKKIQ